MHQIRLNSGGSSLSVPVMLHNSKGLACFCQWQRRNGLIHGGRASMEEMGEGLKMGQLRGSIGIFRISLSGGSATGWLWKPKPKAKVYKGSGKKEKLQIGNCGSPWENHGTTGSSEEEGRGIVAGIQAGLRGAGSARTIYVLADGPLWRSTHWCNKLKEHLLFNRYFFRPWSHEMSKTHLVLSWSLWSSKIHRRVNRCF